MTLPDSITIEGFVAYLATVYPVPTTPETEEQQPLIETAYRQLYGVYRLSSAPLASMQDAVYAQALFLFTEGTALRSRMNLRAQGVMSAGVVKESYDKFAGCPVCPEAAALLSDYEGYGAVLVQRERDMYDDE